jgi:hypothetical protein
MLTVAEYADSRNISESTVKAAITKLQLDLHNHPADKRKRLISLTHQSQLDAAIPKATPPLPTAPITVEVMPHYERAESVSLVMAEAQANTAIATSGFNLPQNNPLYQALAHQVQTLELENIHHLQNIQTQSTANLDATAAISAIDQLRIIQAARTEAAAEFMLKQQVKAQALTEFELQSRGLAPVVQIHPTPPPTSQSSPPSAVGVRSSGSTASSPFD